MLMPAANAVRNTKHRAEKKERKERSVRISPCIEIDQGRCRPDVAPVIVAPRSQRRLRKRSASRRLCSGRLNRQRDGVRDAYCCWCSYEHSTILQRCPLPARIRHACASVSLPYFAAQANSLEGGDLAMADKKLEDPTMAEQPWKHSG